MLQETRILLWIIKESVKVKFKKHVENRFESRNIMKSSCYLNFDSSSIF